MKKIAALVIMFVLVLSAVAFAEVDTSKWVEMPVAESGYVILLPDTMEEEELPDPADGWTEKDTLIYVGRCNDLAVEIGKFEENPNMEEVKHYIDTLGLFDTVEINEDGVLECLGGDDSVSMLAFGNPETGIFCMTVYPLEADPDSDTVDMTVGIEMADAVLNSLKPVEAE